MKRAYKSLLSAFYVACLTIFPGCLKYSALPILTTTTVSGITSNSAVTGGTVDTYSGADVTGRGVCWSKFPGPSAEDSRSFDGTGSGMFSTNLKGLTSNTTYYVRAYATNSAGTAYGNQVSFTTKTEFEQINFNPSLSYGSVTDIEGNIYKTIQVGPQVWMAENLRTTRYNDGQPIPEVQDNTNWIRLSTGGYCWYNNDPSINKEIFGALYNWYAANSGKLCPAGWHLPDSTSFPVLLESVTITGIGSGGLQETSNAHWTGPQAGVNNNSGWTALPGGVRNYRGIFAGIGSMGSWWYSVKSSPTITGEMELSFQNIMLFKFLFIPPDGYSVRCVKNE